ncbi:MAG: hypothetical protein MJK11_01990 [Pseudomonadales bacterium]|nr:hypothetical protein [Pseudomonadales bacterium]
MYLLPYIENMVDRIDQDQRGLIATLLIWLDKQKDVFQHDTVEILDNLIQEYDYELLEKLEDELNLHTCLKKLIINPGFLILFLCIIISGFEWTYALN